MNDALDTACPRDLMPDFIDGIVKESCSGMAFCERSEVQVFVVVRLAALPQERQFIGCVSEVAQHAAKDLRCLQCEHKSLPYVFATFCLD